MSKSNIQLVISVLGIVVILIGVLLAYQMFQSASVEISSVDVTESLSKTLEILAVVGFKGVFLGIMIWAGSILLSNGLRHWPCEGEKREGKSNE